ncbi:MAG: alpha-mannosidase [Oscillospiraceae bacterium]|jgi:alpha-mannosidase|nr:alpha-mannosidase [Oscillospiraceae bacterium]
MHFGKGLTDRNGERYMLPDRIRTLLKTLRAEYVVFDTERLFGLQIRESGGAWRDFGENEVWGGRDKHYFFRQTIVIPERMQGREVRFCVAPGANGGWKKAAPQALLKVDGQIVQGMDSNHRDYILTRSARAGQTYEIEIDAYCDLYHYTDPLQMRTALLCIDPAAEKLFYDMKVPLEIASFLPVDDLNRIDLLACLNAACSLLDLRTPHGEMASTSFEKAQAYLDEHLYGRRCGEQPVQAICVGHTHIDVAWRWTYAQTRDKVARSFATVLQMMHRYPAYRFMSPQPQLYAYLKEDHPALYEQVKRRIKEGRWEVEGGMWVEADTNLPSGESLVRQFLYGTRFFEREFGKTCRVLWLPDVFGYSAALPQIMKKSGIDSFMTTKISWNEYNKIPYDTFKWRGIDGSEVLSHFICAQDYEVPEKEFQTAYSAYLNPSNIMGAWKRYQQKNLNRQVLISYGHGDGGGGPEPDMVENGMRLARGIPGSPQVQFGRVGEFFEQLEKDVQGNPKLPRWSGELYFEYHRGTYTSMALIKRLNRQAEYLLQGLESAAVLAEMLGCTGAYPRALLADCWRTVLTNQFHDVLPGSSIGEVYDDVERLQRDVIARASEAMAGVLARLDGALPAKAEGLLVFNPLSFDRVDLIEAAIPADVTALIDGKGHAHPVQHTGAGASLAMAVAPSKGCARAYFSREAVPCPPCCTQADAEGMENAFFALRFDEKMHIASLMLKRAGLEMVPPGKAMNRLIVYEDRPKEYPAWNTDIFYREHSWLLDDVTSVSVLENGPVRCTVELTRRFLRSTVRQRIAMYAEIERIDIQTRIDWQEHDLLVKADFPTNINAPYASFDIQFGNLQRTTHENTTWDFAQFEVCAHKWADLSQDDFGLSILNDCKYGYEVKDGHIRLTLLKSPCDPNPKADKGLHEFTYSLYPHLGGWRNAGTDREGFRLNCPLTAYRSEAHPAPGTDRASLAAVDREDVLVDTVKFAEDDDAVILRVYENMNRGGAFRLKLGFDAQKAERCNLLEREPQSVALIDGEIRDAIRPYEILTYRVMPGR